MKIQPATIATPAACRPRLRSLGPVLLALALLAGAASVWAEEIKNSACLDCHGDKDMAPSRTNANGAVTLLLLNEAVLKASVHATNSCVSCHADLTSKHPDDNVPVKIPTCTSCHPGLPGHQQAEQDYTTSVHGSSHTQGSLGAAKFARPLCQLRSSVKTFDSLAAQRTPPDPTTTIEFSTLAHPVVNRKFAENSRSVGSCHFPPGGA